ncbi:SDR family NAD(P)-dependent oxidoreductase [Nocardia sp. NPDC003963]
MEHNRTAVVTGATGGIGEAITRALAAEGMTVIMVGRDSGRMAAARQRIRVAVPAADLRPALADLSLVSDVRALADELRGTPLDVVISNAAVITDVGDRTAEGVQRMLATNHLAPYLLLRSLGESLAAAGRSARFVVVGGDPDGLRRTPVDLDDLGAEKVHTPGLPSSFRPFLSYARTKNMNAMFVYGLARRLAGTGITVNGVHPGVIPTTRLGEGSNRGLLRFYTRLLRMNPRKPGPEVGADTPVWLVTAPEVSGVTGEFFVKRKSVPTADHTTDTARCDRLWEESARLVRLPVGDHYPRPLDR